MHGRSRMAMDPGIPTMPRWGTSGFHQPDSRTLLAPSAKGRKVLREPPERRTASFPEPLAKDGLRQLVVPAFLLVDMTAPMSYTLFSGVACYDRGAPRFF